VAITFPKFALGLDVFNPTFALPGTSLSNAAGWTASNLTETALASSNLPEIGHTRAQRLTLASGQTSGTYSSAFGAPGLFTKDNGAGTRLVSSVLFYRGTLGGTNTLKVNLSIALWKLDGTSYSSSISVRDLQTTSADWAVDWTSINVTYPGTGAAFASIVLTLSQAGTKPGFSIDLAFANVGCYSTANSGLTLTRKPTHPGTFSTLKTSKRTITSGLGRRRVLDDQRSVFPFSTELAFNSPLDASTVAGFRYLHAQNGGQFYDGSTAPEGGAWPILCLSGNPGCLPVGLYDFVDDDLPFRPAGDFFSDPPLYIGTVRLLERPV
jgi:hypothetical protein